MSKRGKRVQIMLTSEELILIEDFRFKHRMSSAHQLYESY